MRGGRLELCHAVQRHRDEARAWWGRSGDRTAAAGAGPQAQAAWTIFRSRPHHFAAYFRDSIDRAAFVKVLFPNFRDEFTAEGIDAAFDFFDAGRSGCVLLARLPSLRFAFHLPHAHTHPVILLAPRAKAKLLIILRNLPHAYPMGAE